MKIAIINKIKRKQKSL